MIQESKRTNKDINASRITKTILKLLLLYLSFIFIVACASPKTPYMNSKLKRTGSDNSNERIITFSGMEWNVRNSNNKRQGPGNNLFSNSHKNVWVDSEGRLHLRIRQHKGVWYCAEVTLLKPLGYGEYTFYVSSNLTNLDINVVAGLFTYLNDMEEIDIEFSKWSKDNNSNAQYVVQPADVEGNIKRYDISQEFERTKHSFIWRENAIHFESIGFKKNTPHLIHNWEYTGADIPKEKSEKLKINLWLNKGAKPIKKNRTKITIDSVIYTP